MKGGVYLLRTGSNEGIALGQEQHLRPLSAGLLHVPQQPLSFPFCHQAFLQCTHQAGKKQCQQFDKS